MACRSIGLGYSYIQPLAERGAEDNAMELAKEFEPYKEYLPKPSFGLASFYRCWRWRLLGWGVYAFFIALTVILGMWGFRKSQPTVASPDSRSQIESNQPAPSDSPAVSAEDKSNTPKTQNWRTSLYQVLLLFTLNSSEGSNDVNIQLEVARWLAAVMSSATILTFLLKFFSGRVLQLIVKFAARDHIVVAGLGRYGHLLVKELLNLGHSVIVIDPRAGDANLEACADAGAIVFTGDPASAEMLKRARIETAARLLILFGDDEEAMRVMTTAYEIFQSGVAKTRKDNLQCVAKIDSLALLPLILPHPMNVSGKDRFVLTCLLPSDLAAGRMLDIARGEHYKVSLKRVLISGPGDLAESLIFNLIRDARQTKSGNPEIHISGEKAESFVNGWKRRFPDLASLAQFAIHEHSYADPGGTFDAAFVCVEESSQAASEAVHLAERLTEAPVIAAVTNSESGLGALLEGGAVRGPGVNLKIVSLQEFTLDVWVALCPNNEAFARATHENYLRTVRGKLDAKRAANDRKGERELLDKPANRAWNFLNEEYSGDNRAQVLSWRKLLRTPAPEKPNVYRIIRKGAELASTDFEVVSQLSDPEIEYLAPLEHDRWMARKIKNGWEYAKVRNDDAKKNPSIRPYADLSEAEKDYDRAVFRDLPQTLERTGYVLVRDKSAKSAPIEPT